MSRESCIAHAPKQAIAIIRADYYRLMERDACSAALLNLFEYWANAALAADSTEERPWVGARPIREFEQMLLGISTDKQIRQRLAVLEARGFIQVQTSALRGVAKSYRVMVPEIQQALAGQIADRTADGFGQMTGAGIALRSNGQRGVGHLTERPTVKQPPKLRSNNQALKKTSKELKKERFKERVFSSGETLLEPRQKAKAQTDEPIKIGTVTYRQPPESIDLAEQWEQRPGVARQQICFMALGHKRPEMVARGVGHWWVGPRLNDFDEHLIQACQHRKRKFQQADGVNDAKGYINNMLRNGDWGNFALRCEEAEDLKGRELARKQVEQVPASIPSKRQPFEWSEQERKASALGLVQFKLRCGEVERARAIARQAGIELPMDVVGETALAA